MSENSCKRCGRFNLAIKLSDTEGYCKKCTKLNYEEEQSRKRREHERQMAAQRFQHAETESRRKLEIIQQQRQMAAEKSQQETEQRKHGSEEKQKEREEAKLQRQHKERESKRELEIETAKRDTEMAKRDTEMAKRDTEEIKLKQTQEQKSRDEARLKSLIECNKMLGNVHISGEDRLSLAKAIFSVEEKKDKTEIKQQNRAHKRSAQHTTNRLPKLHEASLAHNFPGYN